jgi:hypothetical protein
VTPIPRSVTDPNQDGIVLQQDPEPNVERNPTFQVIIYVGDYAAPPTTTAVTTTTTTGTP